ncbi:Uma2 family endonuclease [bacterium]|nr:Uma2 family endonuclease [bacterium]
MIDKVSEPVAVKYKKSNAACTDLWDTPDDGNRYEIIEGELIMTPPPNLLHQEILGNIYEILSAFVKGNRLGKVYFSPVGVVLSEENQVQPDLVFISKENQDLLSERGIEGAPDLIIEIISPSTASYDKGIKKNLYERYGVKEYIIIDPYEATLERYVLTDEKYRLEGVYNKQDKVRIFTIDGLKIELIKVFK